jgi:membrane-associated phospholipid phosphatase
VFLLLARRPWQRVLAAAYAPTTALVVVATGNHWVLDVVVGALLVTALWLLLRPRSGPTRAAEPAVDVEALPTALVPVDVPAPRQASVPPEPAPVSCGGTAAGRR